MDVASPTGLSPDLVIFDAEHGDDGSHFYFLPPMVPEPGATGAFDANQPAVVEVCEWTGSDCALAITDFSVGAGTISVTVGDEHYLALWHAGDFDLGLSELYRIRVLVGAQELGYADVQPVANGGGLKNIETGEVIGLVDSRTLPIKFRIEEGAIDEGNTIDATALTAPTFALSGPSVSGSFPSATPLVLDLAPGSYTVNDGATGVHEFEITAAGLVSYAAAKEPFFDGLGTVQLTLVGYGIDIDATVLTAGTYSVGGIGGFPSATIGTFTFLPGLKSISDGSTGVHEFEVTDAGLVSYGAAKEPFFDGLGTVQLTLVGYSIDIDATVLTAGTYSIGGIGGFPSATIGTFTFLPGLKSIQDGTAGAHEFEVTEAGLISYGAAKEPFFDGLGTSELTLVGYAINIDATALVATEFFLSGSPSFSTAAVQGLVMLPGIKSFVSTDGLFDFEVQEDGLLEYDTLLDTILTGRGTNLLTVTP
jgi:hypothetical protein